jgi:hypothetical protein
VGSGEPFTRRSVELQVPAHVAYERLCRTDEYGEFRAGVRDVRPLAENAYLWELADIRFTARVVEQLPDRLLRWQSVHGPAWAETIAITPLSPQRSRVTIDTSGPPAMLAQVTADLSEFKRRLERDHPQVGHFVNERPTMAYRHRSNWRDDLCDGATADGPGSGYWE